MLDLAQVSWKQAGWLGDPQFPTAECAAGEEFLLVIGVIFIDFSTLRVGLCLACGCVLYMLYRMSLVSGLTAHRLHLQCVKILCECAARSRAPPRLGLLDRVEQQPPLIAREAKILAVSNGWKPAGWGGSFLETG